MELTKLWTKKTGLVSLCIQRDPIGYTPRGLMNLFVYVGNNPINFNDPMGLEDVKVNGQIWRKYKGDADLTHGEHWHNIETGEKYHPDTGDILNPKTKKWSRASGKFIKRFSKALGYVGIMLAVLNFSEMQEVHGTEGAIVRSTPGVGYFVNLADTWSSLGEEQITEQAMRLAAKELGPFWDYDFGELKCKKNEIIDLGAAQDCKAKMFECFVNEILAADKAQRHRKWNDCVISNQECLKTVCITKPCEENQEKKSPGGGCFVAGTKVETINGPVAIEKLKIGDKVLSYNFSTGKTEYRPVTKLFVHNDKAVYDIKVDGHIIHTTKVHKIWVKDVGYQKAVLLKTGTHLINNELEAVAVESASHNSKMGKVTVYNITVELNHNYFVSDKKILVSNRK